MLDLFHVNPTASPQEQLEEEGEEDGQDGEPDERLATGQCSCLVCSTLLLHMTGHNLPEQTTHL